MRRNKIQLTPSGQLIKVLSLKNLRPKKRAPFHYINQRSQANKNPTNHRLYHALMEALIADEDAMDKEVADKALAHGSTRVDQLRGGNLFSQLQFISTSPPKVMTESSKKPRESLVHLLPKQHPLLLNRWQITDTRDAGDMSKQDEGNVSDMEDTNNAHIPKVSTTTWFKPIPESERPATPEPEWTIPPNDFPKKTNFAKCIRHIHFKVWRKTISRKTIYVGPFIKWFCRCRTGKNEALQKLFRKQSDLILRNPQCDSCQSGLKNMDTTTKEIILRRADFKIQDLEKDFKNLHPNDLKICSYSYSRKAQPSCPKTDKIIFTNKAVNMWIRNLTIRSYPKPRAVVSETEIIDRKLMELNELQSLVLMGHDKSNGKADQMVKDFHLYEYNNGMVD
ncbi:hypothetical protein Tco_0803110 [Tanacetum coccineum]|uniref:Uncharacterized protein n=1 Tax=Tanacetum coccineum TaxID=301880 RepID=A0ABQ5A4B4_9ASTR